MKVSKNVITILRRPTMRKVEPKFKPIPFKVVKKVVLEDFEKYANRFSEYAQHVYLSEFKRANSIQRLLQVMAATKDSRSLNGSMELLLDLLIKE